MLKCVVMDLVLAVFAASLVGCATGNSRENQEVLVIKSQIDVLKKLVSIRSQDTFKAKIKSDTILQSQEDILASGINSVIESQEAFLKCRAETLNNGDVYAY